EARSILLIVRIGAEIAIGVFDAAYVEHQRAPSIFQRTRSSHVDRAGQALADQGGIRGLVDDDPGHQLRRILVKLYRPIVAGADLLAPIQQGPVEIRAKTANADV